MDPNRELDWSIFDLTLEAWRRTSKLGLGLNRSQARHIFCCVLVWSVGKFVTKPHCFTKITQPQLCLFNLRSILFVCVFIAFFIFDEEELIKSMDN